MNLLRLPDPVLYPMILVCSILGVYAVNSSVVDVWIMLATGVLGYVLRKLEFETAPIVLGLVLAPMMELSLRQSLAMSAGNYAIFGPPGRGRGARRTPSPSKSSKRERVGVRVAQCSNFNVRRTVERILRSLSPRNAAGVLAVRASRDGEEPCHVSRARRARTACASSWSTGTVVSQLMQASVMLCP